MKGILLLEDDENLNRAISFRLEKEGYRVLSTSSVKGGMELYNNNNIDLIICDVGLEDGSGFDFCRDIRKKSNVFIIFLTALDMEIDIVSGYDLGADDYITKPFSLIILISKINALMKRVEKSSFQDCIVSGDITFAIHLMKVSKKEKDLILSKNELKLLKILMIYQRQIISKEQLLTALWDLDGQFVEENTVAVNIRRLREKIEDNPSNPKYIKNIRGAGYMWVMECVRR